MNLAPPLLVCHLVPNILGADRFVVYHVRPNPNDIAHSLEDAHSAPGEVAGVGLDGRPTVEPGPRGQRREKRLSKAAEQKIWTRQRKRKGQQKR